MDKEDTAIQPSGHEYEAVAEVEEDLGIDYLRDEEHAIGRITDAHVRNLDNEAFDLLILTVRVDGQENESVFPLSGSGGLPAPLDSYPDVSKLTDLLERRVPVQGTGGAVVSVEPLPDDPSIAECATSTVYEDAAWLWKGIQCGNIRRNADGSYVRSERVERFDRLFETAAFSAGLLHLVAGCTVVFFMQMFPLALALPLMLLLFFAGGALVNATDSPGIRRYAAGMYGLPIPGR